jgi:hypothetical protein
MVLGALAWFADQQIVAATVYAKCPVRSHAFAVGVGVLCALMAILGGLQSWRARRALTDADDVGLRTDRFIATLSICFAVISLLAVIFGSTAGMILRCER